MDTIVLKDSVTGSMTDEEFLRFCEENKDLRIERNSNLEILIMSPVGTKGGFYSGEIFSQLSAWNKSEKNGLTFDSSTGFTLPDRSMLSPDASWVSNKRWSGLSESEQEQFAPICPEFVVEVRSKTDSIEDLKNKMKVWIRNGAQLGWLIDPYDKTAYLFKADHSEEINQGFERKLKAGNPVNGFELDLSLLKI
jgi:Uma2 family endonuclease